MKTRSLTRSIISLFRVIKPRSTIDQNYDDYFTQLYIDK